MELPPAYGVGDTTYRAAGGEAGIRKLVDAFYDAMAANPEYATILRWHGGVDEVTRDKLARFLCGWTGGPRRYQEAYGPISIPRVHAHLDVTAVERDQWLACMSEALARQDYPDSLVGYLLEQLAVPAERIRQACEARTSS